tara:strand:+ start:860 stop:1279 length:420 start_codon:yes stop_codon:yes gene_type:complete
MTEIKNINKWEKAVISLLNFDGFNLEWCGDKNFPYDAIGTSPKGLKCVLEMKFRKTYYKEKMLEKSKYDKLMALGDDVVKLFFVNDTKGNYLFYLDHLKMPDIVEKYCPDKTFWTSKRLKKPVYLLNETDAIILNKNEK